MKKEKLKHEIVVRPAFDRRNDDPKKDYGIGSCIICFGVIGKKGAITVTFFTNWYLPSTVKEYKEVGINRGCFPELVKESFKTKIDLIGDHKPLSGGGWDYHSKKPIRDWQEKEAPRNDCEWTKGKCYCDGSYTKVDAYIELLLEKGSDGVFERLEEDYEDYFIKKVEGK